MINALKAPQNIFTPAAESELDKKIENSLTECHERHSEFQTLISGSIFYHEGIAQELNEWGRHLDGITLAPGKFLKNSQQSKTRKVVDITITNFVVGLARVVSTALMFIYSLGITIKESVKSIMKREVTDELKQHSAQIAILPLHLVFEVLRAVPIVGHFLGHGAHAICAAVTSLPQGEDKCEQGGETQERV